MVPGHVLLVGPDGHGKRSMARAFAEEYGWLAAEISAAVAAGDQEKQRALLEFAARHITALRLSG